uniref:Uncharacterized protein n=1 Tax=Arundo donax TaxID=35708 RepID=A0A0A9EH74_ARUDO
MAVEVKSTPALFIIVCKFCWGLECFSKL